MTTRSSRSNNLDFYYGSAKALHGVSIDFPRKQVTALIGPSGCGKSTLLRCFNRMNDLIDIASSQGNILLNGAEIYAPSMDVIELRRRVGMVFQKSNPFPKSIYENVIYGLRIAGEQEQDGARRDRRAQPQGCRPLGRGQGSPARSRPSASPAARCSGSASPGRSPSTRR